MSWNTPSHEMAADSASALGALRAVLAAAERLGVARNELLAAAVAAEDLDGVDYAVLARLRPQERAAEPADGAFIARVRDAMRALTAEGRCTVDTVARELAVSPRTLQRRLERAGTTFNGVCDDIRRDAALEHLRNPRVAIKEA